MKKYLLLVTLYLVSIAYATANEQRLPFNSFIPFEKSMQFGVWTIYNNVEDIWLVDSESKRLLEIDSNDNPQHAIFSREVVTDDDIQGSYLTCFSHKSSASISNNRYDLEVGFVQRAQNIGEIQNGRYQFDRMIYQVDGDTMIITNTDDIEQTVSGRVFPEMRINKNNNGVLWIGERGTSEFPPTVTATAQPVPVEGEGSALIIQPAYTGSWFDPASDGRGGFINIADQNGQAVLVVAWFDYNDDGSQKWLVGNSAPLETGATSAIVPVQVTQRDSGGTVQKKDWGVFTFQFKSCNSADLKITPNDGSFSQSLSLTRLTKIKDMSC